jgi:hypothetical protein
MFFTEDQIKRKTKCSKCNETFVDPRNLPCGNCICNKCIDVSNTNEFDCFCCSNKHLLPENGFPVCKIMLDLLNEKPEGFLKFDVFDKLNVEMKIMKETLDNFSIEFNQIKERLSDYCEVIKTQIEIKTESVIQQIEKSREELLKQVDEYQTKCEEFIENKREPLITIIGESSQFYEDYEDYLRKQNIVQCDILTMTNEAIKTKEVLGDELTKLNTIFEEGKITFNESQLSFSSDSIGCVISYEPISPLNTTSSPVLINNSYYSISRSIYTDSD